MKLTRLTLLLCAVASLSLPLHLKAQSSSENKITLNPLWPDVKFDKPVDLVLSPEETPREFLVQQRGKIVILPKDRSSNVIKSFLDISDREMEENTFEEGLLGLAFHPEYKTNRRFFIYYTMQEPKRSVISEMTCSENDPDQADLTSEKVLLEIRQPYWNHNSGNILFDPQGMLVICVGDGGKRDGPHNLSQNLFVLNGKILRINVDAEENGLPYGIPADNPFTDDPGTRQEIFAYGLRNPWGPAFHPETKELWVADVGQERWEEINVIKAGKNYGWNWREGREAFVVNTNTPPAGLVVEDPVFQYERAKGISITGGVFTQGKYVFGDWGFGTIWTLDPEDSPMTSSVVFTRPSSMPDFKPNAFCLDAHDKVMVLTFSGKLYEMSELP